MRLPLFLALTFTGPVQAISPPTMTYCPAQVIVDNVLGVTYKPVLRLAPGCPAGSFARVRKSSTLNLRRHGAPYQPIRPLIGAWNVTATGSTIPPRELWTLLTWRWEFYDGTRWAEAEVLR